MHPGSGTERRGASEQPFELLEHADVQYRDLQLPRVQAVALAEPIPACELVGVIGDDHGDDAFERRFVGWGDTQRSSGLWVREGGLEFRLGHVQLVLPVAWISQHLCVEA